MGRNFKFQAQDSFLEYFLWEIGRFEKRILLSEKKELQSIYTLAIIAGPFCGVVNSGNCWCAAGSA